MKSARPAFIPEIQGLRTVALLMVATFHVWFGRVSGGVDAFLLISAFLMTRSLVMRSESGAPARPITYLIRRFSRLLPTAAAAILLILVGVFVFMPQSMWLSATHNAMGSAFYVENLRLQDASVNYFSVDHADASPFQHFWSLSVQGQVFVLFAFIHAIGAFVAKRLKVSVRGLLLGIFAAVAIVSFVYSVWLTAENQVFAYFSTGARIWEFAVGSLLALAGPWIRLPPSVRSGASWLGIAALLACGFVLPVQSSFPGVAALWPVIATSLVIVSAGSPTRFGADRILAHGVLRRLGNYTYALYLTHWPILIIFLWVADLDSINWWQGLIILLGSAALSAAIRHGVERPVARWVKHSPSAPTTQGQSLRDWMSGIGWRAPLAIFVSLGLVVSVVQASRLVLDRSIERGMAEVNELQLSLSGANADPTMPAVQNPVPAEFLVEYDWTEMGTDCEADDPYLAGLCYYIPAESEETEHTLFAIGSSHSTQFNGTLLEAVNRHPAWAFRTQVAAGCYFDTREAAGDACVELWDQSARYIAEQQPDLVVLFASRSEVDVDQNQWGLVEWIREAHEASPATQIVALRDNPRNPRSPFICAVHHGYNSDQCVFDYLPETDPEFVDALTDAGALWVDLNAAICPDQQCRPSRGGIVTYLDEGHLTSSYTRSLAQVFTNAITSEVEWWPKRVYEEGIYVNRATNTNTLEDLNR